MRLFRIILALLFLNSISVKFIKAQFYSTGQDPASAKWEQINTHNFQVIFQKEFQDKGQQIANILEYYYHKTGNSLNHKPRKISIVVHNHTIASNGYVGWAPKRMELYTTPPQNSYPDFWLNHLCIHELRHVVQVDKLNQGVTKILSIVFGQQATGLVAGHLPFWYLEGDAVCTETAFSKFGRGRLPFFHQGVKTHLLSDEERFSFDKVLFGSYREYVPNHYEMGYQTTSYARMKYGNDVWSNVHNHVAKNSYTLFPTTLAFYRGLKKYTGLSQEQLYEQTMNHLAEKWQKELDEKVSFEPKIFQNYKINEYEDYINPISINPNEVIALKKGYSHIPQFVHISNDHERVIYEPGIILDNSFTYSNDILVWAEYKPDIRWANREYNSIRLMNVKTGIDVTLVEKSRYFSPAISNSTEKIAVVEVDKTNKSSLVLLNSFNGIIIDKIPAREDFYLTRPMWGFDEKEIYLIETTDKGKRVSKYNIGLNQWADVFNLENADIQKILPVENKVYFHSTLNGTDNIYVFDETNKEIYQITNSKFGISDFSYSAADGKLVVNEKTSKGFRVATVPVERAVWRRVDKSEKYSFEFADVLTQQEKELDSTLVIEPKTFDVKKYRKSTQLFNFHSWIPFYFDYQNLNIGNIETLPSELANNLHPGLMLLSQNKLSTVETVLSYAYKEGNHFLSSSMEFKGQYPVLRLKANYGNEQLIFGGTRAYWQPQSRIGYSYQADLYVPFNFSKGKYIKGFMPLVSVDYSDNLYYNFYDDYYLRGMKFVQTQLLYYAYERKASKDIIPKLGAVFELNLFNTPFESELFNYMYNFSSLFYFPGGLNKGFSIDFGYQYQKPNLYLYGSDFRFPRGIIQKRTEKMLKLYSDYVFPIAYPEWNLGSLLYLKRLRGNIFADYAYNSFKVQDSNSGSVYWFEQNNFSFGLEIKADYHLLRTIFPLNAGLRFGYTPTEGALVFDVLFGIDLGSL